MDELTRERFWPRPMPKNVGPEHLRRQLVLISADDAEAERLTQLEAKTMQAARLRAEALIRSRRLAKALKAYEVKSQ